MGGAGPQRLLLGRTLLALEGCWPGAAVEAEDVAGLDAARALFARLLQQVGRDATRGAERLLRGKGGLPNCMFRR